jgi:hypothetical protein
VPARRPQPVEPRPVRASAGDYERPRRSGRRVAWFVAVLLVLIVVAIVAVVALNQSSQSIVQSKQVIAHDWQSAVSQVQKIISHYTR